jgi:hypothetical protein
VQEALDDPCAEPSLLVVARDDAQVTEIVGEEITADPAQMQRENDEDQQRERGRDARRREPRRRAARDARVQRVLMRSGSFVTVAVSTSIS